METDIAPIIAHFKQYYIMYAATGIALIPIIFVTRRYSLPIIFYTVEIVIYWVVMHIMMHVLVMLTKWFKEQSSMKALGDPERAPDWQTPLLIFWKREDYNPTWVFYFEIALAVVILYLVYRFRPPKLKRTPKRQAAMERQQAVRGMNPRYKASANSKRLD